MAHLPTTYLQYLPSIKKDVIIVDLSLMDDDALIKNYCATDWEMVKRIIIQEMLNKQVRKQ